jgi:hypothetical protein
LPKLPAKTRSHHPKKISAEAPLFERGFGLLGDDDGGQFVLVFEVEDLGAPNPRKLSDDGECSGTSQNPGATKNFRFAVLGDKLSKSSVR